MDPGLTAILAILKQLYKRCHKILTVLELGHGMAQHNFGAI